MSDIRFNGWLHRSGTGGVWQDSSGNVGIGSSVPSNAAVSANTKVLNVGVITATTYYGSGANLTGITGTTINNNADNRLITGAGTANTLEGEANLTYNGNQLVQVTDAHGEGIKLAPSNDTYAALVLDANRTGADTYCGSIEAKWNGSLVSFISFETGTDTTNKDDGLIAFSTRESGQSIAERLRITPEGDVLIGHVTSTTVTGEGLPLQVQGSGGYTGMSLIRTSAAGAQLQFAAGSSGNNVADNNGLGYVKFFGYHTNGYDEYARIHAEVDGTPGDGDAPGAIVFSTTNDGASSVTERMRLKSSTLTVNATLDVDSSSTHHIDTDINSWGWRFYQSNSSSPYGMEIKYDGTTRDDSLGEFINCLDTTAVRFKVTSDGDVWNHDNSYGGSDQTLKENIVDASSKLEDLKKLKVRNFNWKADHFPERSKRKMLGFIAQEVEEVFPSLIKEYNITGDNDNPIMKKAIKQAWAPILVKALQEAVAKIETLETKVAALESA